MEIGGKGRSLKEWIPPWQRESFLFRACFNNVMLPSSTGGTIDVETRTVKQHLSQQDYKEHR